MITQSVNTVASLINGALAGKIDDISAHYLAATIIEALKPEEQMIVPMPLHDRVDVGTKIIRGTGKVTVEKRAGRDWSVTYIFGDEKESQTMEVYGCATVEDAVKEARYSLDMGNSGEGYEILSVVRIQEAVS